MSPDGWSAADADALSEHGFVVTPPVLGPSECAALVAAWDTARFRKSVVMARHGFGRGEYRYFAEPLPEAVVALRSTWYARLAPIACRWAEAMDLPMRFPPGFEAFRAEIEARDQTLPTPLLLRYGPGDYNCLHQDRYGPLWFPLQVVILLDEPGVDFDGGELTLVEQRPRAQSRVSVLPLRRGACAVIPCHQRPRRGPRGFHRATVRHGVSEVRSGRRHALGLIFHGAVT